MVPERCASSGGQGKHVVEVEVCDLRLYGVCGSLRTLRASLVHLTAEETSRAPPTYWCSPNFLCTSLTRCHKLDGVSEETPVANDTEVLARVVLHAANRTQAHGSSVRLVVPRAPEVAYEVGVELTESQLVEVEEYLHYHGYVEPVDMGLSWGTYTITSAGLAWLEGGKSGPLSPTDRVREFAQRLAESRPATGGTRSDAEERQQGRVPRRLQRGLNEAREQLEEERSWWRRMFEG
jgi:hypothetical protein